MELYPSVLRPQSPLRPSPARFPAWALSVRGTTSGGREPAPEPQRDRRDRGQPRLHHHLVNQHLCSDERYERDHRTDKKDASHRPSAPRSKTTHRVIARRIDPNYSTVPSVKNPSAPRRGGQKSYPRKWVLKADAPLSECSRHRRLSSGQDEDHDQERHDRGHTPKDLQALLCEIADASDRWPSALSDTAARAAPKHRAVGRLAALLLVAGVR